MNKVFSFLRQHIIIIIALSFSVGFFFVIYGNNILNPYYLDWMSVAGGDADSHLGGFNLFINDDWHWPLMIKTIGWDDGGVSLLSADPVPIMAIFFKICKNYWTGPVQGFGIYILICYILQAIAASLLAEKFFGKNSIFSLFAVFFIITTPILIVRSIGHTSLVSHYLILFSLLLFLKNKFDDFTIYLWYILFAIAIATHPYIFAIQYIIYTIFIAKFYIRYKNISLKQGIIYLLIPLIIGFSVLYSLGFFSMSGDFVVHKSGIYNLNIASIFLPFDNSHFLKSLPVPFGQYEGLCYIGSGLIIGLLVSLPYIIKTITNIEWIKENSYLILYCVILYFIALNRNIYIFNLQLLSFEWPIYIESILGTFQASGRFFWPVYYLIILGIIKSLQHSIYSKEGKNLSLYMLILITIIQITDFYPSYKTKSQVIKQAHYQSPFINPSWNKILPQYTKLYLTTGVGTGFFHPFVDLAIRNKLALSYLELARTDLMLILRRADLTAKNLLKGICELDTMYIIDNETANSLKSIKHSDDFLENLDGYWVFAPYNNKARISNDP